MDARKSCLLFPLPNFPLFLRCSNQKNKKSLNAASPKAEFELAAQLGMASESQIICRERFANCPYTAPEMMAALRNAQF